MKKNIKIEKYLFIISGIVILLGFLYDVYFAGIPYQDPPPEILESYELHNFVATTITKIGFILLIISLVYLIAKKIFFKSANNE